MNAIYGKEQFFADRARKDNSKFISFNGGACYVNAWLHTITAIGAYIWQDKRARSDRSIQFCFQGNHVLFIFYYSMVEREQQRERGIRENVREILSKVKATKSTTSMLRVKRAACEGVRWMGRFWSWWNEMPCDPIRLAQRADQIVRASLCITGINIAILLVHLFIVWWLFL